MITVTKSKFVRFGRKLLIFIWMGIFPRRAYGEYKRGAVHKFLNTAVLLSSRKSFSFIGQRESVLIFLHV